MFSSSCLFPIFLLLFLKYIRLFFLLYSHHLRLLNLTIKITDHQVKFEFQVNDTFSSISQILQGIYSNCIHDLFEIHIQLGVLHLPGSLSDSYTWSLCRTGLFILILLVMAYFLVYLWFGVVGLSWLKFLHQIPSRPRLKNVTFASARCRESAIDLAHFTIFSWWFSGLCKEWELGHEPSKRS